MELSVLCQFLIDHNKVTRTNTASLAIGEWRSSSERVSRQACKGEEEFELVSDESFSETVGGGSWSWKGRWGSRITRRGIALVAPPSMQLEVEIRRGMTRTSMVPSTYCGLFPVCNRALEGGEGIGRIKIVSPDTHTSYETDCSSLKGVEVQTVSRRSGDRVAKGGSEGTMDKWRKGGRNNV